jgi:hypothetical protein
MYGRAIRRVGVALTVVGFLTFAAASAQPPHDAAKDQDTRPVCCHVQKPAEPTPKVVADLIAWIVGKTGWTNRNPPPIEVLPREQIVKMFSDEHSGADGIHIEAAYSDDRHILYLSKQWKPESLRDRAILLHELVHHLQDINKIKAACRLEYEKQAYELSIAWLRDNGVKDPYALLGIDERFIYLMSHCPEF